MGVVYFIIALSLLVAIHEFGHFICAKLFNVYVYEFSLFMGPKLLQVKKGETKYTLRLLPIGGYCSMAGEQDLQAERNAQEEQAKKDNPNGAVEEIPDIPPERTLSGIASWKKLIISSAGAIMNIIFCFVLLLFYFGFNGLPQDTSEVKVVQDSLFAQAGIESGDTLVKGNAVLTVEMVGGTSTYSESDFEFTTYTSIVELDEAVFSKMRKAVVTDPENENPYGNVTAMSQTNTYLVKKQDNTTKTVSVTREFNVALDDNNITQITYSNWGITQSTRKGTFGEVIAASFKQEVNDGVAILKFVFVDLWTDKEAAAGVTGIVGIAALSNDIIKVGGFMYFVYFVAYISVNLGIMNLLPLPALDGGRNILTIYEIITRKKVNPKFEGVINTVGFILLMGLMVIITIKDIINL